jgi:deoxyhypusine synthase
MYELGRYLQQNATKADSILQLAFENSIPVFCPDITFSRAGYGLLKHYYEKNKACITINPLKDLEELGKLNLSNSSLGIVSIGEDTITNMAFNIMKYSEQVGEQAQTFKYALLFSDINSGDRACYSSNLKEATSKGFVKGNLKKHIGMDTKISIPLLISYLYHSKIFNSRKRRNLQQLFQ